MIRTPKTAALLVMTILLPAVTFSHAHDLPEDPLILLTEAAEDPCSICAEQKRRQAFRILNEYFVPGLEIGGSETCRMMKPDREDALVLTCYPSESLRDSLDHSGKATQVVFAIYTPQNRLVGIPESGYTEKAVYDLYQASPAGTVFEGRVRLTGYAYGDGLTFNYFRQENRLQFHCIAVELKPVAP
ncbi:MAG TPA: hypothetical protein P5047_05340 [Desulfomonilia bacterium]|jgi:hypothetical protein|nr:hypothetical protein [Deltaproteobacteria bacterium]HRS55866.1 hypothetical protein [Desulfomonilia bacterium]HRV34571.1 hypothetical protein [Desulfomonilia bacterium]